MTTADDAGMAWAQSVWDAAAVVVERDHPGLLALGGRPGDVAILGDLLDPREARRRVVEELLEAHGALRGLDVDLYAITVDQADELFATITDAARKES